MDGVDNRALRVTTMNPDGQREMEIVRPRLAPEMAMPPYSYVTGRFPHPTADPAGHSFGIATQPCPSPEQQRWRECRPYLHGLDLFNHGYYWEAHEAWEGVWHAAGRTGPVASFIKGLIKLAAAGVKVREGRSEGVRRHARRAKELFLEVAQGLPSPRTLFFGLSPWELGELATAVASDPPQSRAGRGGGRNRLPVRSSAKR